MDAAIKRADNILDNTEQKIVSITKDVNKTILEVVSQIDRVGEKVQSIEQQINEVNFSALLNKLLNHGILRNLTPEELYSSKVDRW